MYWHIDTDILSLIVIAAIYFCNRTLTVHEKTAARDRCFSRCVVIGFWVTVVDIASSLIMEYPISRLLYHFLMTLYFVTVELVIVEWFLYVLTLLYPQGDKSCRTISHALIFSYALYVIFVLSNPWTELIYRLGANNEYSRGPFFAIMLLLYSAYTLVFFCLILIRWNFIPENYPRSVLLLTPIVIALGIAVQLTVSGWLTVLPSYMICLLLAFLFLQAQRVRTSQKQVENLSRVAETDPLTGLFNRSGMNFMVQQALQNANGQDAFILIADIDDLKRINDTLGHAQGDLAIRLMAMQLRQHFRTCDTVVRYGGDEFLIIVIGGFTEAQINTSLRQLVKKIVTLRVGDKADTSLHCSIGVAYGTVGNDSFSSLCDKADKALYYVKRHGKNNYAFYFPEMENETPKKADDAQTSSVSSV